MWPSEHPPRGVLERKSHCSPRSSLPLPQVLGPGGGSAHSLTFGQKHASTETGVHIGSAWLQVSWYWLSMRNALSVSEFARCTVLDCIAGGSLWAAEPDGAVDTLVWEAAGGVRLTISGCDAISCAHSSIVRSRRPMIGWAILFLVRTGWVGS